VIEGAVMMTVRRLAENFCPTSRSRPDHDRVFHVPMEILENEGGFERHGLQVTERLSRLFAVIEALGTGIVGIVSAGAGLGRSPVRGPTLQHRCRSGPARSRCSTRRWPDSGTNTPRATRRTARISSTVSITTIGVEELSRI